MTESTRGPDRAWLDVEERLRAAGDASAAPALDFDRLWATARRQRLAAIGGSGAVAAVVLALAVTLPSMFAGSRVGSLEVTSGFACPVTIPTGDFNAPSPWPSQPAAGHIGDGGSGSAWFGTADLWTVLPLDGQYNGPRKSVWWSQHFEGGGIEPQPDIAVTWRRLDAPGTEPIVFPGPGTNANTGPDGWFMIAGIDPYQPGCWEVTATYRGHELAYVYEQL